MNEFMKTAYQEALHGISKKHGGPFGCVIVKDGKIVAQAHNEVLLRNDPTAHGEVLAIRKACESLQTYDLHDCILFTSAKPCPMCKGAIQWSRIPEVYYSGDYNDTLQIGFDDLAFSKDFQKEENWHQIDQEQFKEIIDAFKQYSSEIKY